MNFKVNLLGGVEILHDGKHLEDTLSAKSVAILTMLVATYPNKLTRTKLSDTLWAESFESSSYNLRYNLWNIKKALPIDEDGEELIITNKEYCYINPKYKFECDLYSFRNVEKTTMTEKSTEELENMRNSFKGDFLEDFYIKDAGEYYEWILLNRVHYQKLYLECLKQLAKRYYQRRHHQDVLEVLEDVLKVSPYDEDSHYQLMEAYVKLGESSKAIAQYKKCDAILRSELNIGPEQKLKDLYLMLISQRKVIDSDNNEEFYLIEVNKQPTRGIEYYGISELLQGLKPFIIKYENLEGISCYKETLGYIDPYFGKPSTSLLDISLLVAFSEIIKIIWDKKTLAIKVYNKDKLDHKSKIAFDYLDSHLKTEKISISYEK